MKMPDNSENLDLIFIIDRSGSMYGSEKDILGGFNSFIQKEKNKELNTTVTTVLFNDKYEFLYKRKEISEVMELTDEDYNVGGCTALLDAIGMTITSLDKEIDNNVLCVIMTDGLENASREFSKSQIANLIKNHNWEFIYLGADIDSYSEAGNIGIRKSRVANYDKSKKGYNEVFTSVSDATDCLRVESTLDNVNWKKELEKYD